MENPTAGGTTVLISNIEPEKLSRAQITKLIFDGICDDGQNGDCIFVFGGGRTERVEKAVELHQSKRAPLICMTGGSRYGQTIPAEAITMRKWAIEQGIPASDILVETESNHTTENVLCSLLVLDRAVGLNHIRRLLVVSSPSHMRRCWLTLQTYMPHWIEYTLCPADGPYERRDNWWTTERGKRWVWKEVTSLVKYVRAGHIIDAEVLL
jgi:hypothetical protein